MHSAPCNNFDHLAVHVKIDSLHLDDRTRAFIGPCNRLQQQVSRTPRPPSTAAMAEYEAERLARIAENKRRMSEIGLAQVRQAQTGDVTWPDPDRF